MENQRELIEDIIIDVRSPSEFSHSHIPNAINLPIFNDDEYKKIGTLYKQNPIEANFLGASLACRNIANILDDNKNLLNHKNKILIYCARGGNRSLSLYSVLISLKLRVKRLDGGYKSYRNIVLNYLNNPINRTFLTLCGNTGCGKSELIKKAESWSIDLENLCNHFGSSFGFISSDITNKKTPSVKMFQNMLHSNLINKQGILLIENESKKLGDIIIPNTLYNAYQNAKKILITCDLEHRIERIYNLYKNINQNDFINTMNKISAYIKKDIKDEIINAFNNNELKKVAELLLVKYYDLKYKKSNYDFVVNSNDINKAYDEVLDIKENYKSHL